jgi:hypothetical protein
LDVVPAHSTPEIRIGDGKCVLRILSPVHTAGSTKWYLLQMAPGDELRSDPHVRGTRENLNILDGRSAVTSATGIAEVSTLGRIFADLVERTAASGAGLILDIDDLRDPLQMRWQRAAVGLAEALTVGFRDHRLAGSAGLAERRLDIVQAEFELVGIALLGLAAEPVPHERINDRLKQLNLCGGLALDDHRTCSGSDHRVARRASITAAITPASAPRLIFTATPSTSSSTAPPPLLRPLDHSCWPVCRSKVDDGGGERRHGHPLARHLPAPGEQRRRPKLRLLHCSSATQWIRFRSLICAVSRVDQRQATATVQGMVIR